MAVKFKKIKLFTPSDLVDFTTDKADSYYDHCDDITVDWGNQEQPGVAVIVRQGDSKRMYHGIPFIYEEIIDDSE
jgi:hypothetical protein